MFNCKLFIIIFSVFVFFNCVSQDYNTENNSASSQPTKKSSDDIIFYTFSKGEKLSTFIETQNTMNRYAKYENIPTDESFREMFNSSEKTLSDFFLNELPEKPTKEATEARNRLLKAFSLNFIYTIVYNKTNKSWLILLIGRSTTLYLEYTSNEKYARSKDIGISIGLMRFINSWIELNNVSSIDNSLRMYLKVDSNDSILEMGGEPFESFFEKLFEKLLNE
jgi:hypothetical protein